MYKIILSNVNLPATTQDFAQIQIWVEKYQSPWAYSQQEPPPVCLVLVAPKPFLDFDQQKAVEL